MKVSAICFALLLLTIQAYPCANFSGSSGTSFNGAWISGASRYRAMELRRALNRDLQKDGVKMEAELRGATNFTDRSDYSIALMYLGRSKEAVGLLQSLEQEQPGKYFIAANLGTAYELTGNNEEAARWIAEGIHRNPTSHEGTEWLHLKILQAKIAQQTAPDYFKKHSVLEIVPEPISAETLLGEEKLHPAEMTEAIQHQLTERMQFVKPPDPAVASLLFDYAAIEAGTKTLESAKQILRLAVSYGYPPDKVDPLMKLYDHRIAMRKTGQYAFYSFIACAALGLLFLLYKKGILVLSSRDLKKRL
jgi:tetratricopeptide (TPR) repeat protein